MVEASLGKENEVGQYPKCDFFFLGMISQSGFEIVIIYCITKPTSKQCKILYEKLYKLIHILSWDLMLNVIGDMVFWYF